MKFDATFWVAISFIIFFGGLIYLKIPKKINDLLNKMILDIKNELAESEKLRVESKILLDKAQEKLDKSNIENKNIINQAKTESEKLIIEMNDKFHKSAEKVFKYLSGAQTLYRFYLSQHTLGTWD